MKIQSVSSGGITITNPPRNENEPVLTYYETADENRSENDLGGVDSTPDSLDTTSVILESPDSSFPIAATSTSAIQLGIEGVVKTEIQEPDQIQENEDCEGEGSGDKDVMENSPKSPQDQVGSGAINGGTDTMDVLTGASNVNAAAADVIGEKYESEANQILSDNQGELNSGNDQHQDQELANEADAVGAGTGQPCTTSSDEAFGADPSPDEQGDSNDDNKMQVDPHGDPDEIQKDVSTSLGVQNSMPDDNHEDLPESPMSIVINQSRSVRMQASDFFNDNTQESQEVSILLDSQGARIGTIVHESDGEEEDETCESGEKGQDEAHKDSVDTCGDEEQNEASDHSSEDESSISSEAAFVTGELATTEIPQWEGEQNLSDEREIHGIDVTQVPEDPVVTPIGIQIQNPERNLNDLLEVVVLEVEGQTSLSADVLVDGSKDAAGLQKAIGIVDETQNPNPDTVAESPEGHVYEIETNNGRVVEVIDECIEEDSSLVIVGTSSGINEQEKEVEAVGWYSSKPCSSSSDAAFVTDPLPFQIPKVDLGDEDSPCMDPNPEVEVANSDLPHPGEGVASSDLPNPMVGDPNPGVGVASSGSDTLRNLGYFSSDSDSDDSSDSDVAEIGYVIYNHNRPYVARLTGPSTPGPPPPIYEVTIETSTDDMLNGPPTDVEFGIAASSECADANASKKPSDAETSGISTQKDDAKKPDGVEKTRNKTVPAVGVQPASSASQIPIYSLDHSPAMLIDLTDEDDKEIQDKNKTSAHAHAPKKSAISCFNCEGSHKVKDCPEPKDFQLTNERKRKFQSEKRRTRPSSGRYFDNDNSLEETQGNANMQPGVISKDLRLAMGLQPNQLPHYIYNMRGVGYPPGYIYAAAGQTSANVYGSNTGAAEPEGPRTLDMDKLPEYPGFTSPVPRGFQDEGYKYGMFYSEADSLQNIKKDWEEQEQKRCGIEPSNLETPGSSAPKSAALLRNPLCTQTSRSSPPRETEQVPWYSGITDPSPHIPSPRGGSSSQRTETGTPSKEPWIRTASGRLELNPNVKSLAEFRGPRNYRVTQELERREEEEKNRKLAESAGKSVPQDDWSGCDYYLPRSESPSILTDFGINPMKRRRRKRFRASQELETDAEVITLEENKVEHEIIEIDCDSPPPPPKKPKLSTNSPIDDNDNGSIKDQAME